MLKLFLLEVLEVSLSYCSFCWLLKTFLKLCVLFNFCEFICIVCRQYGKKGNSAWLFLVVSLGCLFLFSESISEIFL